ncbi:hypothetical protein [Streptomyces sp. NRRL S-378]|uniref:hypothetical protein n=1 Tax=Streptomyces sp. NRRL S-378 TaxID=1463904 RepID=UPI0004C7A405|nr:hypothetical protein [Streptomyces sp. NRRL S-378]
MSQTFHAQCRWAENDFLKAYRAGASVHIEAYNDSVEKANASIPAAEARAFARGIIALCDEIDGGEAKPASPITVRTGDRLRVTEADLNFAAINVGDVLVVTSLDHPFGDFATTGNQPGDSWGFDYEHIGNGLEPVNEPPADDVAASTVTDERAARLELLEAAKRLAPGGDVADWLRIAAYLEGN